MDSASDWYSALVPAIIYATSHYIGPQYNGTRLYHSVIETTYFIQSDSSHKRPETVFNENNDNDNNDDNNNNNNNNNDNNVTDVAER